MALQTVSVDPRSLDEIYAAAQRESGPLVVAAGGDGTILAQHTTRYLY